MITQEYQREEQPFLKAYLGAWKGRIKSLAASAHIELINTVDPWAQLFSDLGDEESTLSITPPTTKPTPAKRARSASVKSPTPVLSTSSQSASVASSEEAPPPPKMLTTRQVNAVGLLYKSIPPNERWKLTSGKIGEDEMEKLAAKSKYEHPVRVMSSNMDITLISKL